MARYLLPALFLFIAFAASGQQYQSNECPAKCRELKGVYRLDKMQEMHDELNEASGLELASDKNLWTHGDGGTGTKLYKMTPEGKMLKKLKLDDVKNIDWEDLARDRKGNLYIGDIGNNKSDRQDLQIIIVPENDPKAKAKFIKFTFSDQKAFPPAEGQPQFDCEAFFWHNNQIYLFNKNASCRDYIRVYRMPDQPGQHKAMLIDSILLNSQISSADISPDGKTVALLGLEELYLMQLNGKNSFTNGKIDCLKIPGIGKSEGITFINETDLILCNENGMLYKVSKIKGAENAKASGKAKGKKG